jgi:hypothetical protein
MDLLDVVNLVAAQPAITVPVVFEAAMYWERQKEGADYVDSCQMMPSVEVNLRHSSGWIEDILEELW